MQHQSNVKRKPRKLARFIVVQANSPKGFAPGVYFYVLFTDETTKVSRYLRSAVSAFKRAKRYELMYEAGDHDWPAVDRCDELMTNPDARPSLWERWFPERVCLD